jgi:hypothetical protein
VNVHEVCRLDERRNSQAFILFCVEYTITLYCMHFINSVCILQNSTDDYNLYFLIFSVNRNLPILNLAYHIRYKYMLTSYRRKRFIRSMTKTHYKQRKHNTIIIGHHYRQTNTKHVDKTYAFLLTTGCNDEPNIVYMHYWVSNP